MDAEKYGIVVPVSDNLLYEHSQLGRALVMNFLDWQRATPQERAELIAEARAKRQAQRERAEPVELSVAALGDKFGWSEAFMRHLVQPYCYCDIGHDGWETCEHARDEGLTD